MAYSDSGSEASYPAGSLADRYQKLKSRREPFLKRARTFAAYTVPYLQPEEGSNGSTDYPEPFCSTPARGVTNLGNKLLLTLFPPNTSFFKLEPDERVLNEMRAVDAHNETDLTGEVLKSLAEIERTASKEIERRAFRPSLHYALLLLVVGGNACAWFRKDGKLTIHSLSDYVANWDASGHLLDLVLCEKVALAALDPDVRKLITSNPRIQGKANECGDEEVDLYSGVRLENGKLCFRQEIEGMLIPDTEIDYEPNACPIFPIRFIITKQNEYGRGRVEAFFGDVKSLEGLSESMLEAAAMCARVIYLVSPSGYTKAYDLDKARNGAYVAGNPDDVKALTVDKYPDLAVVREARNDLLAQVSFAFLLNSAVQRDAERVTAEEIRYMAQELEDTLGGAYSTLTQEFQYPVVKVLLAELTRERKVPKLPKDVQPRVVTGVEALGRSHELARIQNAMATATQTGIPPEVLFPAIEVPELIRRIFVGAGVDIEGLLKSPVLVKQEAAQAKTQALIEKVAPNIVTQAGGMMAQNQAQAAPPQQS